jgi:D-lactate dehydrogenase (cytochrome)
MKDPAANSINNALDKLRKLFGDRLSTNESVRDHHSRDESWHEGRPPDAVCFVNGMDEVSSTMKMYTRHRIPVIRFVMRDGMVYRLPRPKHTEKR